MTAPINRLRERHRPVFAASIQYGRRLRNNHDFYSGISFSIVRQMIECIKAHRDGRLTIIFGGGYEIEEKLLSMQFLCTYFINANF